MYAREVLCQKCQFLHIFFEYMHTHMQLFGRNFGTPLPLTGRVPPNLRSHRCASNNDFFAKKVDNLLFRLKILVYSKDLL